jgi:pimeloyl-ACP methyl ester carboxylesterase
MTGEEFEFATRSRWIIARKLCLVAGLAPIAGLIGAALYAEVRLRLTETLDPALDAPGGGHLVVDGQHIHYEDEGKGLTIVLIHGFGGSTYSWRKNIKPLAEAGYRVLALDLIGFGYSERSSRPVYTGTAHARLVRRFLETLANAGKGSGPPSGGGDLPGPPYVLIGNSMGAAVALRFAADYPGLTKAVVVTAPAIFFRRSWTGLRPILRVPGLGRLLARTIFFYALGNRRSAAKMLASAYGSRIDEVTAEMREAMLRPLRVRGSANAAYGLGLSYETRSLFDDLSSVEAPVLVVAGGRDRAVPIDAVRRVHQRLPHSELIVLPDAGHLVQEDAPDDFNRLVVDFIRARDMGAGSDSAPSAV